MQTHPSLLSAAATLGAAMFMGAAAIAADLPKEGTYSGTTSGYGTYKAMPVGKERLLLVFNDFDSTTGNGLFDHTTSNCFGLGDFTKGVGHNHGYCVVTDVSGDKIVLDFVDEEHPLNEKGIKGSFTLTSGTGNMVELPVAQPMWTTGPSSQVLEKGPISRKHRSREVTRYHNLGNVRSLGLKPRSELA
jgi:hypothetical protein